MNKEINTNNSKKLIIGVSILFCTVILIIGVTTAYFTQSGVGDTGNIVTANINGTIGFSGGSNEYMRNNLIPVKESDVSLFAMKNTSNTSGNYTNDDICHYQDDMYACSLYEFTITNNADVTQDMKITLTPNPNGFANLHYMMYIGEQDKLTTESKVAKTNTHIDGQNPSTMINSVILKPQESKTYTVVFYIKAMDYDQTLEDADKNFGAIIRVDSITNGAYKNIVVGNICYEFDELDDGTLKLSKFNGIDAIGNADSTCGVTKSEDGFYTVRVPSTIGNTKVSTLGNNLFTGVDMTAFELNNYSRIEKIIVEEGITTIEDGSEVGGTFTGVGVSSITVDSNGTPSAIYYDREISISLPSTLTNIGTFTFAVSGINDYKFNLDENNNSNLKAIKELTFFSTKITNLTLPASINTIGEQAFAMSNITNLTISGDIESLGEYVFFDTTIDNLVLKEGITKINDKMFYDSNIISDKDNSLIIPKTVTYIGNNAFLGNENLTAVTFEGALDGTSQLDTVGIQAFNGCDLNYQTKSEPLIIPTNIKKIGSYAFDTYFSYGYKKLKYILYLGNDEDILNNKGFAENEGNYYEWYADSNEFKTTLLTSLDQMTE